MRRTSAVALICLLAILGPLRARAAAGEAEATAPSPADPTDALLEKGERLWNESRFAESKEVLEQALSKRSDDPEILWRLARDDFDLGNLKPLEDKDGRLHLFGETERLARKCIEAAPNDGQCHFWLGAALGRQATSKGILSAGLVAKDIFAEFLKSVELGISYRSEKGRVQLADAYNAIGQLYRLTPDLWIADTLVGVRGDIERSAEYQRKALEIEPERLEILKELGASLVCLGKTKDRPQAIEEGKALLDRVVSLPSKEPADDVEKQHARLLLGNLDLCCDYSRDAELQKETEKQKEAG